MKKILIVEDDQNISDMEKALLTKYNYDVTTAYSGTEALLQVQYGSFDIILLDLMLPGLSGEELLPKLRKLCLTPVIAISAKDDLHTKVDVIRSGADDYITKPFNNDELLVRIEALLRRSNLSNGNSNNNSSSECLKFKDISVDIDNHTVIVNEKMLDLTQKEYDILVLLMSNPKKVFTKDNIYESVWNEEYFPEDNAVSVHISNLRNKLAAANADENYIKTVWGIGFKLSL